MYVVHAAFDFRMVFVRELLFRVKLNETKKKNALHDAYPATGWHVEQNVHVCFRETLSIPGHPRSVSLM